MKTLTLNLKFASPAQRVGYIVGNAGFLETILQVSYVRVIPSKLQGDPEGPGPGLG